MQIITDFFGGCSPSPEIEVTLAKAYTISEFGTIIGVFKSKHIANQAKEKLQESFNVKIEKVYYVKEGPSKLKGRILEVGEKASFVNLTEIDKYIKDNEFVPNYLRRLGGKAPDDGLDY